jgi:hypothetical protein
MAINPSCNLTVDRTVTQDGVDMTFKISILVEDAQDISSDIFVTEIVDSSDLSQDVFNRVATVNDLMTLHVNREDALTSDDSYYRTAILEVEYDDIQVAVAANTEIQARVTTLINDWEIYVNDFLTENGLPESVPMPGADADILAALVATYNNAKSNREQSETTLTEKQLELTDADADHAYCISNNVGMQYLQGLVDDFKTARDGSAVGNALFPSMLTALTNAKNALPSGPDKTAAQNAIDSLTAQVAEVTSAYGDINSAYTDKVTEVSTKKGECQTLMSTYMDAEKAVAQAQTQVDAATAAEAAALEDIQECCPGWTESS